MKSVWNGILVLSLWGFDLKAASLVDTTFNVGTGADGIVEQVLQQPDGKVLICGNFTKFNGQNKGYCARLNEDGSVDATFDAHPGYWTRHMALQPDGKIVICGYFKNVGPANRNLIARLNADGSLDTTFDPGSGAEDKIAAAIDGNIDPFVFWAELQPDGKILATGNFLKYNGASSVGIVRINPDGTRDTTFNVGPGLDSWGRSIKLMTNGQVLLTGWFTSYNGSGCNRIVRINPDGTRDLSLNPFYGDKTSVYSVAIQPDGHLITSGHSLNEQGMFHQEIVRLKSDNSFDETWPASTNEKTECLLMQPDGSVILVGYFSLVNGAPRQGIARLNANGTLDPAFAANADNYVWTVTAGGSNKVYVSGGFTTIDGISTRGVARLNVPPSSAGNPTPPPAPTISNPRMNGSKFECAINSGADYTYVLQYQTSAGSGWTALPSETGNGGALTLSDPNPTGVRFYRVEAH